MCKIQDHNGTTYIVRTELKIQAASHLVMAVYEQYSGDEKRVFNSFITNRCGADASFQKGIELL